MGDKPDGGAARPSTRIDDFEGKLLYLRDYFAAQALVGLLTSPGVRTPETAGPLAYRYADAMLKARDA